MWRYFLPRWKHHQQNGTKQTLFPDDVARDNYALCAMVWDGLTEQEREIQFLVHCTGYDETDYEIKKYAKEHGMTVQAVWSVSHRIGRKLGVLKGLAAEKKEGASE